MTFRHIILLIIFYAIINVSCKEEKKVKTIKVEKTSVPLPLVVPPVAKLNPPFESFEVNVDSGVTYLVKNSYGTKIFIPDSVFVDSTRNLIRGKVKIMYREFHDAAGIFLAGIPMNYDAAGIQKYFETAGMFDIRAEQNGNPVYIDSGKVIKIHFGSVTEGNDYHCFYLDEKLTRNWHYMGDVLGAVNTEKSKLKRKATEQMSAIKIPFEKKHFAFNYMALLDVYLLDKPKEIANNKQNPDIQNKIKQYNVTWSNIYNYETVTFQGNQYLASLLVWKNLTGDDFPDWVVNANSKLTYKYGNVYDLKLEDKKGRVHYAIIEAVMPIKSLFAFSAQQWKIKYEETLKKVHEEEERIKKMADVYRIFEINKFGMYNYDKFLNDQNKVHIAASFNFDKPVDIIQNIEVCYVSGNNRSLIKYPYDKWKNFIIVPDDNAKLFALLPGDYLAVYPKEKLATLNYKQLGENKFSEITFDMFTVRKLNSEEDLREILN
jgi:hypothetical protein